MPHDILGKSFGGILGKKKIDTKPGSAELRPVFFYSPKRSTNSARGFPASAQSADRVRATGDKVQLNQYYCRETKSLRGNAGRFHGLNRPAQRITGSPGPLSA